MYERTLLKFWPVYQSFVTAFVDLLYLVFISYQIVFLPLASCTRKIPWLFRRHEALRKFLGLQVQLSDQLRRNSLHCISCKLFATHLTTRSSTELSDDSLYANSAICHLHLCHALPVLVHHVPPTTKPTLLKSSDDLFKKRSCISYKLSQACAERK